MGDTHARKSSFAIRAAEALVLIACALVFIANDLILSEQVSVAMRVIALLPAIGALGLCVYLALRGDAGMGVVAAGLGLIISYVWIGHFAYPAIQQGLQSSLVQDTVRDAHIWVNGVDIGQDPVRLAKAEFLGRVPQNGSPPPGFPQKIPLSFFSPDWKQCWTTECDTVWHVESLSDTPGSYYVQARYAGEAGAIDNVGFFVFPQRDQRLQLLLNKARLDGYHVGPGWFGAIETFNEDGWIALRRAAETEPAMDGVLTDWAKWKFGLDSVHNASDAWAALQRVCREADHKQRYCTTGVGGRAVELLAAELDPAQVVDEGKRIIVDTTGCSYARWTVGGRLEFSTMPNYGEPALTGDLDNGSFVMDGGGGPGDLAPGKLPIVHALLELWRNGRGRALMQSEIGPDLLAWHYESGDMVPLLFAAGIGGPEVDRFLLAQPWRASPASNDSTYVGIPSVEVNRWFYLLAHLNDDAGRRFRRAHADQIVDMARKVLAKSFSNAPDRGELDFVLSDPDLARRFWPSIVEHTKSSGTDAYLILRNQYRYLEKMNAAPSAYIDAWRAARPDWEAADQATAELRFDMPADRARPIAAALADFIDKDPQVARQIPQERDRRALIDGLNQVAEPTQAILAAVRAALPYLTANKRGSRNGLAQYDEIALWLSRPGGCSPVVAKLATAPEPALRLLCLNAIRGVPTLANRELLQKLLADPEASVRTEARGVQAELGALAAEPLGKLTSSGK